MPFIVKVASAVENHSSASSYQNLGSLTVPAAKLGRTKHRMGPYGTVWALMGRMGPYETVWAP